MGERIAESKCLPTLQRHGEDPDYEEADRGYRRSGCKADPASTSSDGSLPCPLLQGGCCCHGSCCCSTKETMHLPLSASTDVVVTALQTTMRETGAAAGAGSPPPVYM